MPGQSSETWHHENILFACLFLSLSQPHPQMVASSSQPHVAALVIWPGEYIKVKPGSHVHPCGLRGTSQGTLSGSPEPYGGKKEQFPKEGSSVCRSGEGGAGQTHLTVSTLASQGQKRLTVPQIHSPRSYLFSSVIWSLQQVSDHTPLVFQREPLCGRKHCAKSDDQVIIISET